MRANDIRELPDDEIRSRIGEREKDLLTFRMQVAVGSVENVRGARNARRDIARMKTVLRERELKSAQGTQ